MKSLHRILVAGVAAMLLAGIVTASAQDKTTELAIVVGKSSPLENITSAELAKYFKAEKSKAPDGSKISIVMQDVGRPERDAALQGVYKMSEAEYNDYFVGQTFTGAVAAAPRSFANGATIVKFVAATPGAIGYARASEVDDSVKVLKIDGKAPGDAGYSLKIK